MTISLSDCWAKTDQSGRPALTVRDHCLNVGAVALQLIQRLPVPISRILPNGTVTLVAAHDIGKITPGFLSKCTHWKSPDQTYGSSGVTDHAKVSQWFLASLPDLKDSKGISDDWVLAAGGHHGRYQSARALLPSLVMREIASSDWPRALRLQLLSDLIAEFGPLPDERLSLSSGDIHSAARVHLLTGLTTFCDWIGSDELSFPLGNEFPPEDQAAFEASVASAAYALDSVGIHRRDVVSGMSFPDLFGHGPGTGMTPRPLQEALIAAVDSAGLYIVEAPMGMGKTEAALAAAYRRWTTPDAERGLYFALPTQLTSQRIHHRIADFLGNVIDDSTILALVHGNAWVKDDRVLRVSSTSSELDDPESRLGAATANSWFASTTRRALLAPFGTGTIDQALLSVLPAKHAALRFFALSGKVIVIDEVHSYDPYTSALVDRLVSWTLKAGCTVIILSATLTAKRRTELATAAGAKESDGPEGYPLITKVITGSGAVTHIPVSEENTERLDVRLEHPCVTDPAWAELATQSADNGACVLIIRNTVALAQETYRGLKAMRNGDRYDIGLLHSRFPQWQRDQQEERWTNLLGKTGALRPHGCILVATQVVEQSVDIDADLLITDMAPTDLLLQRIGRLHRHNRQRPNGFTNPRCVILHPPVDWSGDSVCIRKQLAPHSYVYPPYVLYSSQRLWCERSAISLPSDIRPLLESTYRTCSDLPPGLEELRNQLDSKVRKMVSTAHGRSIFRSVATEDREGTETRWMEQKTATLVLVHGVATDGPDRIAVIKHDGSRVTADVHRFEIHFARELQRHAVRVPRHLVACALRNQPGWLGIHIDDAVVAVCNSDRTECEIDFTGPRSPQLHYHPEFGVFHAAMARPANDPNPVEEWDDGWF